ncbi:hypothetical protein ACN27G_19400 [Plantactinospora sp. WMMB334]|uniref:hypothetical protein n=1 Tax=Plantactinospora sp. WMMB334 TaxID=3404119 RepID=UPI003B9589DE
MKMSNSGTPERVSVQGDEGPSHQAGVGSITRYVDGTVAEFDVDGNLVRQAMPNGTVFSAFDADNRPVSGYTEASQFTVTYAKDDNERSTAEDAASAEYAPDGAGLRQEAADGTVYESFDSLGRPHEGTTGGLHFAISYRADGSTVTSYDDGSSTEHDASGSIVRQTTADGVEYAAFDSLGRPQSGLAEGAGFTISYQSDNSSTVHYANGSSAHFGAGGNLIWQDTGEGTVYNGFDAQGRPLAGRTDDNNFTIEYDDGGGSWVRYADGTVVEFDRAGDPVRQTLSDGGVYSGFDGEGRPTVGVADGQRFSIGYDDGGGGGGSWVRYADGTVVEFDRAGDPVRQTLSDGGVYSGFDGEGRPTVGVADGVSFAIQYDDGGGSWVRYADGTVVEFDRAGDPVRQTLSDGGVYSGFDGEGRPTVGVADGVSFAIQYDDGGGSWVRYADGTVVEFDRAGDPVRQTLSDGGVYSGFDGEGRPTVGVADGVSFAIQYDDGGGSWVRYADGTVVEFDRAGDPVRQTLSDGGVYSGFDGEGRPTVGVADGVSFAIQYDDGGGSWVRYADGTVVEFDRDGDPVRQTLSDGGVYSSFDGEGRPTLGVADGVSFAIQYDDGGGSWVRYADGTVVEFDRDGDPVRQTLSDGGVYSSFDGEGRPTVGVADGQRFSIGYDDGGGGGSWVRYADGTVVEFDRDGDPVRQTLSDGGVYSSFDGEGRPTLGVADGVSFAIQYDDGGGSWVRYADGTVVEFDRDGDPVRQTLSDGGVYSGFDGEGRPTLGVADGVSFAIQYDDGGGSWVRYADGTVVEFDRDGDPVRQTLSDGGVYSSFDGEGRPTVGVADGQRFSIGYDDGGGGGSWVRYADGTVVEFDRDGDPVRQTLSDGGVYSSFDGEGRPTLGVADGVSIAIQYDDGGGSWVRYADGTVVEFDRDGDPVRQTLSDGGVYSSFDGEGRPTLGVADGVSFAIQYDDGGGSWVRYADGTVVEFDRDGDPVRQTLSDGGVYSSFDGEGRPTLGVADGVSFAIQYDDGGGSWVRYADGTVVEFDRDGDPVRQTLSDGGVYSGFDGEGRPTLGVADGVSFAIQYDDGGGSWVRYADGTVVEFDRDGDPVRQTLSDGGVYSSFDGEGRPTVGVADGQRFSIGYDDDGGGGGGSWVRYADGTVVEFDRDGDPVRQTLSDGGVYSGFDGDKRPTEGFSPETGAFSIEYPTPQRTVHRYESGTVVEYGQGEVPIRQELPDNTVFTAFDEDHRPTEGTTADGDPISITYHEDGTSAFAFGSGALIRYDANDDPYWMRTVDNSTFNEFYGNGTPKAGRAADGDSIRIGRNADGSSEISYGSGALVRMDSHDDPYWMRTADGTTFTDFHTNGAPKEGATADGDSISIKQQLDGASEVVYGSGAVVRLDKDDDPFWMRTADGTTFTEFYVGGEVDGSPKSGRTASGESIAITYGANGTSEIVYGSGAIIRYDDDDDPYWMKSSDNSIFTVFDEDGRPTLGKTSGGGDIVITYNTHDNGFKVVVGNQVTEYDPNGDPIKMTIGDDLIFDQFRAGFFKRGYDANTQRFFDIEYLPDGDVKWVFGEDDWIRFDEDGEPIDGFRPGPDGGHYTFSVEIPKLAAAADLTEQRRQDIESELGNLRTAVQSIETYWKSPAGGSFQAYAAVLSTAGDNLLNVLEAAVTKLRATHETYVRAETQNADNLTPK